MSETKLIFNGPIEELSSCLFNGLNRTECTYKITDSKSIYVRAFIDYAYTTGRFNIYRISSYSYYLVYNTRDSKSGDKLYRYIINKSHLLQLSEPDTSNHLDGPDAYLKYIPILESDHERGAINLARLGKNIKYDSANIDTIMNCFNKYCYGKDSMSISITTNLSITICNIFSTIKKFKYEHFVKMGVILDPMLYWCKHIIDIEYSRNCLKTLSFLCSIHDSFKMVMKDHMIKYTNKFMLNRFLRNTGLEVLRRL